MISISNFFIKITTNENELSHSPTSPYFDRWLKLWITNMETLSITRCFFLGYEFEHEYAISSPYWKHVGMTCFEIKTAFTLSKFMRYTVSSTNHYQDRMKMQLIYLTKIYLYAGSFDKRIAPILPRYRQQICQKLAPENACVNRNFVTCVRSLKPDRKYTDYI